MANNCLVTKLKGTVNNDNLLKFGEFVIINSDNRSGQITLRAQSGTITVTTYQEDGTLVNTYNVGTSDENIAISSSEKKISVDNKYNLSIYGTDNLILASTDLNALLYSNYLRAIYCSTNAWLQDHSFDILNAKRWSNLINITLINSFNITGTLNDIATHPNVANIENIDIHETAIRGSLNDVTSMPKITLINVSDCPYIIVTRSALNALSAQGCTVRYNQTPIEDV